MDIKRYKLKEPKCHPPNTTRYCLYCEKETEWVYNPSVGHSQCSECGLRKVPFSKNLIDHKGDIVEKEYKNTPKNQKQNKGRQNQIQSSLPRLLNKKVRCTLSNSEVLEGVLIDISQYEIILTIDNEEIMILKHALMTIKEVKDDSTQEIL